MIAETMDKPLAANEKVYRFGSLHRDHFER